MIPRLKGWRKRQLAEGVLFTPADDDGREAIFYRERVRPLLPIEALVDDLLARHPEFSAPEVTRKEQLITYEGEYAVLITIRGTFDGKPAQSDLGFVLTDDFYAATSAFTRAPERFADATDRARALVLRDRQMLGVRRRRFLYSPPAGWHGVPHEFVIDWRADDALITVWPATPLGGGDGRSALDELLSDERAQGFELHGSVGPEPLQSQHGLKGHAWEIIGRFGAQPILYRDIVVFEDRRYLYFLRLQSVNLETRPAHRQIFADVVRSAQPIPESRQATYAPDLSLLLHWIS